MSQPSNPSIYARRITSGDEFRLLTIFPSSDPTQRVECSCTQFPLDLAPPYEALSYTWGEPTPTAKVFCNGEAVTVGLNLGDALAQLRLPDVPRTIWADALCINQYDHGEKSHQVPMMGKVYSQAIRVIVWLGRGNSWEIAEAFQTVKLIATACRDYGVRQSTDFLRYKDLYASLELENLQGRAPQGLTALYSRPWFSRLWCVQEICLAKEGLVFWGDQSISWGDIGISSLWIQENQYRLQLSHTDQVSDMLLQVPASGVDAACRLYSFCNGDFTPSHSSIVELLHVFHDFVSRDHRDKIYGLFSLAQPRETMALCLDYDKSVGDVYADTARCLIRVHSNLDILSYVKQERQFVRCDGYRSWAPRWDAPLGFTHRYGNWSAAADKPANLLHSESSGSEILRLAGIFYNNVTAVEKPVTMKTAGYHPDGLDLQKGHRQHPLLRVRSQLHINSDENIALDEPWIRMMQSLFRGLLTSSETTETTNVALFGNSITHFMEEMCTSASKGWPRSKKYTNVFENIISVLAAYCRENRVFWMQNGTFGLGPRCIRPSDVVVVLFGGRPAYILRPHGEKYFFLGTAYVDGIMDGELVREMEAGKRQEQVFCLV